MSPDEKGLADDEAIACEILAQLVPNDLVGHQAAGVAKILPLLHRAHAHKLKIAKLAKGSDQNDPSSAKTVATLPPRRTSYETATKTAFEGNGGCRGTKFL